MSDERRFIDPTVLSDEDQKLLQDIRIAKAHLSGMVDMLDAIQNHENPDRVNEDLLARTCQLAKSIRGLLPIVVPQSVPALGLIDAIDAFLCDPKGTG